MKNRVEYRIQLTNGKPWLSDLSISEPDFLAYGLGATMGIRAAEDSMNAVPDFTDAERWVIESTLRERYGERTPIELADAEVRLDPETPVMTTCPTVYWHARGAHFVVLKTAEDRYRTQFFYSTTQQYGTGRAEYDDLLDCVVAILRAQADHEKETHGVHSGMVREELGEDEE
jgi:hypothetical protein